MDVVKVLLAAAAVVGLIEWIKRVIPKATSLVWHIALLPLCVGIGLCIPGSIGERLLSAGALLLICQVGYQLVIQGVIRWFKAIAAKAGT